MNWLRRWRERREKEWWDRFHREHRWDRLGTYNAERGRGVVHSQEYQEEMAEEQRQFNEEQGYEFWDDNGDGIVGRSPYGWMARR